MPKFGFESEWESGAAALSEALAGVGLITGAPTGNGGHMHRYHCRCENCVFEPLYDGMPVAVLRAQTDSSCNGEIISKPFVDIEEALPVFRAIQEHSIEVDAVPGHSSGLHVHVEKLHLSTRDCGRAILNFCIWQEVLMRIARGRFRTVRSANVPLMGSRGQLRFYFSGDDRNISQEAPWIREYHRAPRHPGDWRWLLRSRQTRYLDNLYPFMMVRDRHNYLNVRPSQTFEFRLWNSTRSAWRMELFCRLSSKLMELSSIDRMFEYVKDRDDTPNELGVVPALTVDELSTCLEDERLSELITRQTRFQESGRASDAPDLTTAVA